MRIALTGGIASGKSTLLSLLGEWGVSCFSADAVARDLLWDPGIQASLMREFDCREEVGPVVLRSLMQQDDRHRRAVNRIFHPAINAAIEASTATIFEIPLLFEACMHGSFDAIWVAFCAPETQTKRMIQRYGNSSNFPANTWQLDSKVALAFADSVILTDGDLEQSRESLLQEAKRWSISLVVS